MGKKGFWKKLLVYLMTFMMVFSTMPTSVFAVGEKSGNNNEGQISDYYEVNDTTGELLAGPSLSGNTQQSYEDGKVKVNKTISATGTENVFDVELTVETTQDVSTVEHTPDAAAVILIDCSNSMYACMACKHKHNGNEVADGSCETNNCDCTLADYRASGAYYDAAKAAAQAFIEEFTDDDAVRKIAIVEFYGGADITGAKTTTKDDSGSIGWANATSTNEDEIIDALDSVEPKGATNLHAGMLLAQNLLNHEDVDGIPNKSVVLISDGAPTRAIDEDSDELDNTDIDEISVNGAGTTDGGTETSHYEHTVVESIADNMITNKHYSLYAAYIGQETFTCQDDSCDFKSMTGEAWLRDQCKFSTSSANDTDEIVSQFEKIVELIENNAQAWTVADPMGTYVDYVGADREVYVDGEFSVANDQLVWDLRKAEDLDPSDDSYKYSLKYRIKLNNLSEYVAEQWTNANDVTKLKYVLTTSVDGEQTSAEEGTAYFNIPSVKGFAGSYYFYKEDDKEKTLPGAVFTLTTADDPSWSMSATSDAEGKVKFEGIPSGHTYTLAETSAPSTYEKSEETHTLAVSYGSVTVDGNADDPITIVNKELEVVSISGTKTWKSDRSDDRPGSITVNLYANGEFKESKTVRSSNDWKYAFTDLPKYDDNGNEIVYTILESAVNGYYPTYEGFNIENTKSNNKTSVTVTKLWDDSNNQDGIRPDSVQVQLKANGTNKGSAVTLNEGNNWTYTWTNLDKSYRQGNNWKEYNYTIAELGEIDGYEVGDVTGNAATGFFITNTHTPETISVSGTKDWDTKDITVVLPSEVTIKLIAKANDSKINEYITEATAETNWNYSFTDLPKYSNGEEIEYTVDEVNVPEMYEKTIKGTTIKNTLKTGTAREDDTLTIYKKDQDGKSLDGAKFKLKDGDSYIDGIEYSGSQFTINTANIPKANLPEAGESKKYTLVETTVPTGYQAAENTEIEIKATNSDPVYDETQNKYITTTTYTIIGDDTLTVINDLITVDVTVNKVWDDANDQDGLRPDSVTMHLKKGSTIVDTEVLSAKDTGEENVWDDADLTHTFIDLPKYDADGNVIEYTIEEATVEHYTASYEYNEDDKTHIVTNSHTPAVVAIGVLKIWDDANDQDGLRPDSIEVQLKSENGVVSSIVLDADNDWSHTWENLPVNSNGTKINYSVTEGSVPDGYTLTTGGEGSSLITLTNKHIPETTEATVKKVWDDSENQDGKRPTELKVTLSNGTEVTLDAENGWTATVENLPKYADGKEIVYTWTEDTTSLPEGYGLLEPSVNGTVTTLTNKYPVQTTEATVKKVWDDAGNQDGKRPESIDVTLSNGAVVTLSETNNWTAKVTGLAKYNKGQEIEYTWIEGTLPTGYELTDTSVNGTITTLTNSHTPEATSATIKKVWDDADNQDGKRPTELKVALSNGTEVTLNAANEWTATVEDLPKYADGEEIKYTWTEGTLPEGYELTDTTVNGTITTLTNSYTPETTEVTVKKVWDDEGNQDGKRPESLAVTLSNGTEVTLNAANDWTATVKNLPKYDNGKEIAYTWTEDVKALPEGYELTDTSVNGTVTTITNSYTPEKTEATVTKVWNDASNQDGKRPENLTITLSNGTEVTLNAANDWTATVKDLPKYANGEVIEYTWTEDENDLPEGYKLTKTTTEGTVTTLTNSYIPETISLTVKKQWNDDNNQDGKRPEKLKVTLSNGDEFTLTEANGWQATAEDLPKYKNGEEIIYTWSEEKLPDGYGQEGYYTEGNTTVITNKYPIFEKTEATVKKVWDDKNDQDGKRPESIKVTLSNGVEVTLSEANKWTATVKDLPKNENGAEIQYTWTEDRESLPEGYTLTNTVKDGTVTTLTNSYTPETTEATVKKIWDDAENQDGKRPSSLNVTLSNGTEVTLNAENNWTATVKDLPKYAEGKKIEYTWEEDSKSLPRGYTLTGTSKQGTVTTLTNSYTPETIEATVKKVWDDANNQDGKRPTSIEVALSNGTEVTLNADNDWTATVKDLPKYTNGKEIKYTWTEENLPNSYKLTDTSVNGTITTLTNSYIPETIDLTVKKIWSDSRNQDGKRPTELKVTLSNGTSVKLDKENGWEATVKDLPKYADGKLINYTWTEDKLPEGYSLVGTSVEGSVTTLTNSYTPETTEVTVKKVWDDNDDQDGIRPESIKVQLYADGDECSEPVTVTANTGWKYTWSDLNKYADGEEIKYTVDEIETPDGYTKTIDGMTITNSYKPGKTSVTVTKVWDDDNNRDAKRPQNVKVQLYANEETKGEAITLNEENNWTFTWKELDLKKASEAISYTVEELNVPDEYEAEVTGDQTSGYVITNSYEPETIDLTIYKKWDDKGDKYDKRPDHIVVHLYANGSLYETVALTEEGNWQYTFEDMPVNANGEKFVYTIDENPVDGYITEIEGLTITNTIDPEELDDAADTGDDSSPWVYGFTAMLALAAAAGAVFVRRREN